MIALEHVTDLVVTVAAPVEVGMTPAGLRRLIPITGGEARGPGIRGRVLALGADFQVIREDGVTELDARYAIQTDDDALIYIHNNGLRHGRPEAPYFRTSPRFETGAKDYLWLNRYMFAAEGVRRAEHVELSIYRVL